jgi:hypothetical protein
MRNILLNAFWRNYCVAGRNNLFNPAVVNRPICRKTVGFRLYSAANKKQEASEEKKNCNVGTIGHVDHGESSDYEYKHPSIITTIF